MTEVRLICNPTASMLLLESLEEAHTCQYRVIIGTNSVCSHIEMLAPQDEPGSGAPEPVSKSSPKPGKPNEQSVHPSNGEGA